MAMNPWVKRKWVKALKSGEYEKGKGYLIRESQYCCLGVLVCEMAPEFVQVTPNWVEVGTEFDKTSYLPDDLAIMWGLDRDAQLKLSRINDDKDTFRAVIAYIEDKL